MHVLAVDNDPIRLGFLAALLRDAGVACAVLDEYVSAVQGGIGAIPRRLVVRDADAGRALAVLRQAGEA